MGIVESWMMGSIEGKQKIANQLQAEQNELLKEQNELLAQQKSEPAAQNNNSGGYASLSHNVSISAQMGMQTSPKMQTVKNITIEELVRRGTLLPEYDWSSKEFDDAYENLAADWFRRHPEVSRGTGEFAKKYPEKDKAFDVLHRMSDLGRITPDEFLLLAKEIYSS